MNNKYEPNRFLNIFMHFGIDQFKRLIIFTKI